jgi:hypothetical protein
MCAIWIKHEIYLINSNRDETKRKKTQRARCSSEKMIRASFSHRRKQDTSVPPSEFFYSFFFQLSATFLPSHFCEPNRRAALPSASSVAALHFLVTSFSVPDLLDSSGLGAPLVPASLATRCGFSKGHASRFGPEERTERRLGDPTAPAGCDVCFLSGFWVVVFLFPVLYFFFGLRGSGTPGLGWAPPRLGFSSHPPLFRFYPHGSAAINRNGARRALIGAARMAVRSRERRVAYESAGPNPSTLGDLTWREGVFRQPVVPARQCTSWGPGRVMALVVQGRGGDTPLPNSAVGANVVSYSAGRSRCFSELLPAGA